MDSDDIAECWGLLFSLVFGLVGVATVAIMGLNSFLASS